MTVPPYAVGAVVCVTAAITSHRLKMRGHTLGGLAPSTVTGFALMAFANNVGGQYFSIFLAIPGAFTASSVPTAWSVDDSAVPTVRASAVAYCCGAGNVGALISTRAYRAADAPRYVTGNCINLGFSVCLCLAIPGLSLYIRWENKQQAEGKRDRSLK
jgi:hypothetical protein